jgi:hypothetical protein
LLTPTDEKPFSEGLHRMRLCGRCGWLAANVNANHEEESVSTKKAKLSKGKKLEAQKPLRDISTIPGTKNTDTGSAK